VRFFSARDVEDRAASEQMQRLLGTLAEHLSLEMTARTDGNSQEAVLARDADNLEHLVQAREYEMQGFTATKKWANSCEGNLVSKAAKELADELQRTTANQ
jgi:putative hydrolase of HD superfamily